MTIGQIPRIDSADPIEILKGVVKLIREEPLRYDQGEWLSHMNVTGAPACGTVCCVAGWVVVAHDGADAAAALYNKGRYGLYTSQRAAELLNINGDAKDQLFSGDAIAAQLSYEQDEALEDVEDSEDLPTPGTPEYVEIGVRHIERFMREYLGYEGPSL